MCSVPWVPALTRNFNRNEQTTKIVAKTKTWNRVRAALVRTIGPSTAHCRCDTLDVFLADTDEDGEPRDFPVESQFSPVLPEVTQESDGSPGDSVPRVGFKCAAKDQRQHNQLQGGHRQNQ